MLIQRNCSDFLIVDFSKFLPRLDCSSNEISNQHNQFFTRASTIVTWRSNPFKIHLYFWSISGKDLAIFTAIYCIDAFSLYSTSSVPFLSLLEFTQKNMFPYCSRVFFTATCSLSAPSWYCYGISDFILAETTGWFLFTKPSSYSSKISAQVFQS